MNDEQPQRQLTIDAAVAVLQAELRHISQTMTDGQQRLEARMDGQSRVLTETREMVRDANSKAATALRMSDANSADIQAIQEWKRRHEESIAVLGGTDAAVNKIQSMLGDQHDGGVRHREWKRIAALVGGGITVGAGVATALGQLGVFG